MSGASASVEEQVETIPILTFALGLPGFPDVHQFVVSELAPESPFSVLRSVDAEVEFVVTSPGLFFPDYSPDIDDALIARLGITSDEEALVLVVVNVGATLADTTANLLGPLVVNVRTWDSAQAVLATGDWSVKTPLGLA